MHHRTFRIEIRTSTCKHRNRYRTPTRCIIIHRKARFQVSVCVVKLDRSTLVVCFTAPPQNNAMPPPMPNYTQPFLMDHGGHLIGQPQQPPPPPPPPQAYMSTSLFFAELQQVLRLGLDNQMMSGRPQSGPYYRTAPQQQLQTPPGPPYGAQDPLAHAGFYPQFFQAPNSNAPPVGHPPTHNVSVFLMKVKMMRHRSFFVDLWTEWWLSSWASSDVCSWRFDRSGRSSIDESVVISPNELSIRFVQSVTTTATTAAATTATRSTAFTTIAESEIFSDQPTSEFSRQPTIILSSTVARYSIRSTTDAHWCYEHEQ